MLLGYLFEIKKCGYCNYFPIKKVQTFPGFQLTIRIFCHGSLKNLTICQKTIKISVILKSWELGAVFKVVV